MDSVKQSSDSVPGPLGMRCPAGNSSKIDFALEWYCGQMGGGEVAAILVDGPVSGGAGESQRRAPTGGAA
jgi:hypothetical protein